MTILVAENDSKSLVDSLQKQPEVIHGHETAQISQFTTQSNGLTFDKPANDAVMDIEKPNNENLFDLSLLEEMDDNEYVSDILTIFLGNTPKELNELKRACISNKFDAIYKMAHKLKSSTGIFQANFLLNVLIKIEENAKAEKNDGLPKLAELAIEEYKKIEIPLKERLRNIQAELRVAI